MQPTTVLSFVQLQFIPDNNENLHFNLLLNICEMHFLRKKRVKDRQLRKVRYMSRVIIDFFIFLYLLVLRRFFRCTKITKVQKRERKLFLCWHESSSRVWQMQFCVITAANPSKPTKQWQTKTSAGDFRDKSPIIRKNNWPKEDPT